MLRFVFLALISLAVFTTIYRAQPSWTGVILIVLFVWILVGCLTCIIVLNDIGDWITVAKNVCLWPAIIASDRMQNRIL